MPSIAIRRFQCRHVFTDGHRCGSPCLRGPNGPEDFCYYHHANRRPKPSASRQDPYNDPPNQAGFSLPIPEDHSAVQLAIGTVMNRLAVNALDPRRAGLLLYALQIASGNLASAPRHKADDLVLDVTLDPENGALAPAAELPGDTFLREFQQKFSNGEYDADEEEEDDDDDDDYEKDEDE